MVQNLINEEEDYQSELDRIKKYYLTVFDNELENQKKLLQDYTDNKNKEFKKCDNTYDRKKAKEYALKYVTTREEGIDVYDTIGGNCQNFASRVLLTGGIPMDTIGTQQWKYYGGTINEKNTKVGRSTSWTGVGQFYAYAKTNVGFGLCSEVNVNSYYAEAGDLIQVGYKNKYRHTAVVVDTVKKDGNVIDVLLNSNTGDLEQFPLSAYVYPEKRLIKVLGWNN